MWSVPHLHPVPSPESLAVNVELGLSQADGSIRMLASASFGFLKDYVLIYG